MEPCGRDFFNAVTRPACLSEQPLRLGYVVINPGTPGRNRTYILCSVDTRSHPLSYGGIFRLSTLGRIRTFSDTTLNRTRLPFRHESVCQAKLTWLRA